MNRATSEESESFLQNLTETSGSVALHDSPGVLSLPGDSEDPDDITVHLKGNCAVISNGTGQWHRLAI